MYPAGELGPTTALVFFWDFVGLGKIYFLQPESISFFFFLFLLKLYVMGAQQKCLA